MLNDLISEKIPRVNATVDGIRVGTPAATPHESRPTIIEKALHKYLYLFVSDGFDGFPTRGHCPLVWTLVSYIINLNRRLADCDGRRCGSGF